MNKNYLYYVYNQIQNNLLVNPVGNNLCDDQYIGSISYNASQSCWVWDCLAQDLVPKDTTCYNKTQRINADQHLKSNPNSNRIIILLESPHIDEFDAQGISRGPAYGKTGKQLELHFLGKLNASLNNRHLLKNTNQYDIIIMNTIRRQCSLGYPTEVFRDIVFLWFWEKNVLETT